jgi:hypothetical protein
MTDAEKFSRRGMEGLGGPQNQTETQSTDVEFTLVKGLAKVLKGAQALKSRRPIWWQPLLQLFLQLFWVDS